MKTLLLIATTLVGNQALASIPSIFPNGKYNIACQSIMVKKDENRSVDRVVTYMQGTSAVTTKGDITTTKETFTNRDESGKALGTEDVTGQVKTKSLGNNEYEQQFSTVTKWKDEAGKPQESKSNFRRTFLVNGGFEINLKVQMENEAEKPAVGESYTKLIAPGVYTQTSYLREGYHRPGRVLEDGTVINAAYFYQSNTTCKYTLVK